MFAVSRSTLLGKLRRATSRTTRKRRMTTVNAGAKEPAHVHLMQWAKKNPKMAAVAGIYITCELSATAKMANGG